MNCNAARGLLPLFVGGDLTEGRLEDLRAHLTACAECARELERFSEARALLEELRDDVALPKREVRRVWTTVRGEIPLLRVPRRLRMLSVLRYAAVSMIGLSLGYTSMSLAVGLAGSRAFDQIVEPAPQGVAPAAAQVPIDPIKIPGGAEIPERAMVRHATDDPTAASSAAVRNQATNTLTVRMLPVYDRTTAAPQQAEINALRQKNLELELRVQQLEKVLKELQQR